MNTVLPNLTLATRLTPINWSQLCLNTVKTLKQEVVMVFLVLDIFGDPLKIDKNECTFSFFFYSS